MNDEGGNESFSFGTYIPTLGVVDVEVGVYELNP